jgi:hypothetical protein
VTAAIHFQETQGSGEMVADTGWQLFRGQGGTGTGLNTGAETTHFNTS